jgi:hypothetical protein
MTRQLIVLIVLWALGLQGVQAAAGAASAGMTSECVTSSANPAESARQSCCPSGSHAAGCCLDACFAAVAVTPAPALAVWIGRTASVRHVLLTRFTSRGDSPLIRPPIL